jgi:hypothetical protein
MGRGMTERHGSNFSHFVCYYESLCRAFGEASTAISVRLDKVLARVHTLAGVAARRPLSEGG